MKNLSKTIQPFFLKLNSFKIFNKLGRFYYYLGLKISLSILRCLPEIQSIYLRNSLALDNWIPWESDIDLTIIIEDLETDQEIKFLNWFWRVYKILNLPFPFIKHIDIFNLKEFTSDILYNDPQLYYLIKDLQLVYGEDYRKTVNYDSEDISSFRIHKWIQFMKWFYEDRLNRKMFIRKYYKFFNEILLFSGGNNTMTKNFRDILSYAKKSNLFLKNPQQFVLQGFCYSLNILSDVYKQGYIKQKKPTRFQYVGADEEIPHLFLDQVKLFVNSLEDYMDAIKSIFIDQGSIQNNHFRIWIILRDNIEQKDFIEPIALIKKKVILRNSFFTYIFTEDVLNLFLTTQRLWTFESRHLYRHAKLICGEDVLSRLDFTSYESIIKMALSSIIIYKICLRDIVRNQNTNKYLEYLLNTLSLKLFLDKNIMVTTNKELVNICNKVYDGEEIYLLMKLINNQYVDKVRVHFVLKALLDNLLDSYTKASEEKDKDEALAVLERHG